MANNPFRPGVGKPPPYLADREAQLKRFHRYLDDFPQNRRNLRVTGLRGVGKTVLIKEYRKAARARGWVVIKRDLTPRLNDEHDFATAITADLQGAIQEMSMVARVGNLVSAARQSVSAMIDLGDGVTVRLGAPDAVRPAILEDRIRDAMVKLGLLARKTNKGVLFLYDEAHVLYDRPKAHHFPLSALLSGFVEAQDHDLDLPVMLVMSGLPPLATNLQAARSHTERLFKVEELGNLGLEGAGAEPSPAAAALTEAVKGSEISFPLDVADRVAADVSGYPYFIQWYGEALWDAADDAGLDVIDPHLYEAMRESIQDGLDIEFFEGRFQEAKRAEQTTMRVAGSLRGQSFRVGDIVKEFSRLKPGCRPTRSLGMVATWWVRMWGVDDRTTKGVSVVVPLRRQGEEMTLSSGAGSVQGRDVGAGRYVLRDRRVKPLGNPQYVLECRREVCTQERLVVCNAVAQLVQATDPGVQVAAIGLGWERGMEIGHPQALLVCLGGEVSPEAERQVGDYLAGWGSWPAGGGDGPIYDFSWLAIDVYGSGRSAGRALAAVERRKHRFRGERPVCLPGRGRGWLSVYFALESPGGPLTSVMSPGLSRSGPLSTRLCGLRAHRSEALSRFGALANAFAVHRRRSAASELTPHPCNRLTSAESSVLTAPQDSANVVVSVTGRGCHTGRHTSESL